MTRLSEEVLRQYRAVREDCGFLERTEVGWLELRGKDRFSWLQGMISNDTRLLEKGAARLQACVLDATGHLLSDITVIQAFGEMPYLLVELPRANVARIAGIFDRLLIMEDVEITEVTDSLACLSLQGPGALDIYQRSGAEAGESLRDLSGLFTVVEADHTGSGGLDIYLPVAVVAAFKDSLRHAGVREIGPDVQEILRVEAGLPKYGIDMDEHVIALEANLCPSHISLTKGCYVGQEIIARIDSRGHTNRALTGLVITEGGRPKLGDRIFATPNSEDPAGRETGRITSVIESAPCQEGHTIALGYVRHEHREPGGVLRIETAEGHVEAEVVSLPFYLRGDL